jgi:hypothetical protein
MEDGWVERMGGWVEDGGWVGGGWRIDGWMDGWMMEGWWVEDGWVGGESRSVESA